MTWITIVEADVKATLNDGEVQKYRDRIAEGDADPLPSIITDTMAEVRGYLGDPAGQTGVPDVLKTKTLDIIVWRLCKRVQTASEPQRKEAADMAFSYLTLLAKGLISLGQLGPLSEEQCLEYSFDKQDGI